ncbi:MAG: D-glucuronyl C5-epimerase domain protein [Thermoleophilia bacterium]|nr:D-glucuronyl C5-epimerase domain protein [Thermoleophilia bacterium]
MRRPTPRHFRPRRLRPAALLPLLAALALAAGAADASALSITQAPAARSAAKVVIPAPRNATTTGRAVAHKPRVDPVLVSIAAALKHHLITPLQAREYRTTWAASARAARTARSASRRASVASVRAYTSNLAATGGLVAPRLGPALLSVKATTYVMLHRSAYPAHESELQIPGEPLVFTYYSGRGVQFQPFETFKLGMTDLNQPMPDIAGARRIADRMRELTMPRGSAVTWEYFFPFGGPSRPWTSSLSQALATEFYDRVSTSVEDVDAKQYADVAAQVARSFLLSPSAGGVSVPQGAGRFYLIYPFNPGQRILNGHLQVLLNLNRYATSSGSPVARLIVDQGITGVVPILPRFDTGAWSNYQPGQEAELGYHEFMTDQLVKLGRELGNETFVEYGARFREYLETPPTITVPESIWPSIVPALDGFRDTIAVHYRTDKRAHLTLVIESPTSGDEVRRISVSGGRGTGTVVWNGRDNAGHTVPDGEYTARYTATDVAGNRGTGDLVGTLGVARDTTPPELSLVALRASGKVTVVTVRASDTGSAWIDADVRVGGALVGHVRGPRFGATTLHIARPIATVRTGSLVLRDSSGNTTVQALSDP